MISYTLIHSCAQTINLNYKNGGVIQADVNRTTCHDRLHTDTLLCTDNKLVPVRFEPKGSINEKCTKGRGRLGGKTGRVDGEEFEKIVEKLWRGIELTHFSKTMAPSKRSTLTTTAAAQKTTTRSEVHAPRGVKRKSDWQPGQGKSPTRSKSTSATKQKRATPDRECKNKSRTDDKISDEEESEKEEYDKRNRKEDSDFEEEKDDSNDEDEGVEKEIIEGDTEARKELEEKQKILEKHKSTASELELSVVEENHLGTSYCERVFHEYKFISNDMLEEEDNEESIMKGAYDLLGFNTASKIKKKRTAVKNYIKYQTGRFREYFVASVKKGVMQGSRLGKK